jgi:ABC-2 type transport system ATP-binding protein
VINKGALILVDEKTALMKKLGKKQMTLSLVVPMATMPPELAAWRLELKSGGRELEYTFDAAESASLYELLRRMSELGIVFSDMNTRERSLEDIFVSLVSERT